MSIMLTQAATLSIGGSIIESCASAALTYMEAVLPSSVRLFLSFGNIADDGVTFVPGSDIFKIVVSVDLISGDWTSSNGQAGTMAVSDLSSVQDAVATIQGASEAIAASIGLVSGQPQAILSLSLSKQPLPPIQTTAS